MNSNGFVLVDPSVIMADAPDMLDAIASNLKEQGAGASFIFSVRENVVVEGIDDLPPLRKSVVHVQLRLDNISDDYGILVYDPQTKKILSGFRPTESELAKLHDTLYSPSNDKALNTLIRYLSMFSLFHYEGSMQRRLLEAFGDSIFLRQQGTRESKPQYGQMHLHIAEIY